MLKSCKGTGRASLRFSSIRKAGCDATLGPRVQRLADTVDEFQLDCKSIPSKIPASIQIVSVNISTQRSVASRLKSPNGTPANVKLEVFRIECEEREETSIFSGKWEPLSGKLVKIYTVQPVSQDSKATDGAAKLNFASSLLEKFSADSAGPAPGVEGVLVTSDSADGGIVGATLANVRYDS